MNKNRKYIFLLGVTIVAFVLVQLLSPRQISWVPTFSAEDKNPFGSYVLAEHLEQIFPEQAIVHTNLTFYEMLDSAAADVNIVAIATSLSLGKEDTDALLNTVAEGGHAFLAADYFEGKLADTLGLAMGSVAYKLKLFDKKQLKDSSFIFFSHNTRIHHPYRQDDMNNYFDQLDSLKTNAFIVAKNEYNEVTTLRIPWGKGELILSSSPLAFTNNYVLYHNDDFIEGTLSYLPVLPVWWTEYYQMGRQESGSPLRVILNDRALAWAYYIMLVTLLVFVIFESKRKQRIIPIIKPPKNATLEFVKTIGNMYLQANNHKAIAEKKVIYFFDLMRSKYFLPAEHSLGFAEALARKSGNTIEDTKVLLTAIQLIQQSKQISVDMLYDLNNRIEKFQRVTALA